MNPHPGCPKRMEFGPCGGVRDDYGCEMEPVPCPFALSGDVVPWTGPSVPEQARPDLLRVAGHRPVVLTDLTVRPHDPAAIAHTVEVLAGTCDGLLVGEHQDRPDFPPTLMTALVRRAGGSPWITLTGRDRNRVVLEQEIAGLVVAEPAGVLCATGDGRAPGVRPGVTQVFDLDGTRIAAMAAAAGLPVAVPESPDAPPRRLRPGRLREKQRAGAALCVLNHVRSAARVAEFAEAARAVGARLPLVASVAVYTDARSAEVLLRFPGLHLDPRRVAAVLDAPDPETAGIDAALEEARALIAVDGVVGVNLSGLASGRGEAAATEIKARIGREILGSTR